MACMTFEAYPNWIDDEERHSWQCDDVGWNSIKLQFDGGKPESITAIMKNSLAEESINSWKQHSSQILNNFSHLHVVEWNMKEYSFRQFNKNLRRIITSGSKFHSYFQLKQSAKEVSRDKCLMHKLLSEQIIRHTNSPCAPAPAVLHQLDLLYTSFIEAHSSGNPLYIISYDFPFFL